MSNSNGKYVMITTWDNPYNPATQWDEWLDFDHEKNHNSCEVLDRFCYTSPELSDAEQTEDIERAIDEIIALDPFDIYRKIYVEKK